MEKFVEGLQVIDRKQYDTRELFGAFFPQGWTALLLLFSGNLKLGGRGTILLSSGEVAILASSFEPVKIKGDVELSAVFFSTDFVVSSKMAKNGKSYIDYMFNQPFLRAVLTKKQTEKLAGHIRALRKNALSGESVPFQKEMMLLWFNLLLYECISLFTLQDALVSDTSTRKEKLFLNFIALVQRHCRKEHSVKFYADSLFVTTGYLGKVVRGVSMHTAKHFIEMAIVAEAYELLGNTALSMADIADELCFTSTSSFSNFFKRYAKVSPRIYRETIY